MSKDKNKIFDTLKTIGKAVGEMSRSEVDVSDRELAVEFVAVVKNLIETNKKLMRSNADITRSNCIVSGALDDLKKCIKKLDKKVDVLSSVIEENTETFYESENE